MGNKRQTFVWLRTVTSFLNKEKSLGAMYRVASQICKTRRSVSCHVNLIIEAFRYKLPGSLLLLFRRWWFERGIALHCHRRRLTKGFEALLQLLVNDVGADLGGGTRGDRTA